MTTRRYPPELFSRDDLEQAVVVAERVKFASIHSLDDALRDIVFAPFVSVGGSTQAVFQGHLVRSNSLLEPLMYGPLSCRLVFQAADGYVSPSVYEEMPKGGCELLMIGAMRSRHRPDFEWRGESRLPGHWQCFLTPWENASPRSD